MCKPHPKTSPPLPLRAVACWKERCERTAASYEPLTEEEQARHERRMRRYYANTSSQVMAMLPAQHRWRPNVHAVVED